MPLGNQMKPARNTLIEDFISLFFPHYCLGCMGALVKGEDILCTNCLSDLPKTNYHLTLDNPVKNKFTGRLLVKHGWAFLKFRKRGMVQHLLHQLKYNNHPEVGIRLGQTFGQELLISWFEYRLIAFARRSIHPMEFVTLHLDRQQIKHFDYIPVVFFWRNVVERDLCQALRRLRIL